MATATMTKTTRENIAACAAHGFYFWSDHPDKATLWATDDNQRWHTIKVSRKHGRAEHVCHRWDPFTEHCTGTRGRDIGYTIPDNLAQSALMMGLTEDEMIADRPNKDATIAKLKAALRTHIPTEVLIGQLEQIVERTRRPEVVASLIRHDPTWMVPFTESELRSALGMTPHDDKISAEIARRREAS